MGILHLFIANFFATQITGGAKELMEPLVMKK